LKRQLWGGAVVLVVAAALLLSACSGGGGSGSSGNGASANSSGTAVKTDHITISNFMFSPMSITVAPGASITVTNKDSVAHTLTSADGHLDTGDIGQNQTKTVTAPTKPGQYHYVCSIHQYMMGTIVVQ